MRFFRIIRKWAPLARAEQKQPVPVLRYAKPCGVQNLILFRYVVSVIPKFLNDLFQKLPVGADGQPAHVLEYEIRGFQLYYYAYKVVNERIAGVVQGTLSDHAKALARAPPNTTST